MNARVLTGLLALLTGCAAVPLSLWWSATERITQPAADYVKAHATPSDLVLISSTLNTGAPNNAGLMRPFGSLAVAVLEPNAVMPLFADVGLVCISPADALGGYLLFHAPAIDEPWLELPRRLSGQLSP